MKKNSPKISYDKESEVLSIELKKVKSADSDIQGNLVIDYDKNGEIVRINLYNFDFAGFRNGVKAFKNFASGSAASVVMR